MARPHERTHRKAERAEKVYIYGRHALAEALAEAPHTLKRAFLAPEHMQDEGADSLRAKLTAANIPVNELKAQEAAGLAGRDAVHQGVIAIMEPEKLLRSFDDFIRISMSLRILQYSSSAK